MNSYTPFLFVSVTLLLLLAAPYTKSSSSEEDPELDPADVEEPGCPKIDQIHAVNLREMLGQWHLPYMSNHWIRYMAKSMHGKFMRRSSMGRSCIKVNVQPMPEGRSIASPNASIWIQSKCPRTGAELNLACSPTGKHNAKWSCTERDGKNKDGDSFVYIVDTDNKTWALIVRCFPNNGMNWAIFSKEKILEEKLVKSLLKEVESLGFRLYNIVEIPSSKCMKK